VDPRGTVEWITFAKRYPVDTEQEHMMHYIQTLNAGSRYDKLTLIAAHEILVQTAVMAHA
jgi:hypothetical protein